MKIALLREVSPNISECEITCITREPVDLKIAIEQHMHYAEALSDLNCEVNMIEADNHPDSVFIEDTAVVMDNIAVITNPGAVSRRAETEAVAEALSVYRDLEYIGPAGTLDGGDVLRVGRTLYVGISSRSSAAGITRLSEIVKSSGYEVRSIPVEGCLHLKSAVSMAAENTLILNPAWVSPDHFSNIENIVTVHPSEPFGANALFLENGTLYSTAYPKTMRKLVVEGLNVISIDLSELAKAEGAVTCCSLIFDI